MIKLLISGIVLLLFTCNTAKETPKIVEKDSTVEIQQMVTQKLSGEDAEFLAFYHSFIQAIQNKNAEALNSFFDKNFGVYFIESNGALPSFAKFYDVNSFKSLQGKSFFELNFKSIDLTPTFETLPKIICEKTSFDKQGCFAEKLNTLAKNEIWAYSSLNEKEKQAIAIFSKSIVYTVVNTYSYTFYFSKTESGWKISFIDLRIPCEA